MIRYLVAVLVAALVACDVPQENVPVCTWKEWSCQGSTLMYCGQTYPDGHLSLIDVVDCGADGCRVTPEPGCGPMPTP